MEMGREGGGWGGLVTWVTSVAYLGKCSDIGGGVEGRIWAKYKKCGPGDVNGAAIDVALAGHAHCWVLSSGDRLLTGPGKAEQWCSAARGNIGKVGGEEGPRPYLLTQPGGMQYQAFAEGNTQQVGGGGRVGVWKGRVELGCPEAKELGRVKSQGEEVGLQSKCEDQEEAIKLGA